MSQTESNNAPIIIAHRGASGYLPEHTIEAYQLAIDLGADYIEPDLVISKDGILVARHDRYLSTTTDVADRPEFSDRKVIKPGHDGADWFVEDFTFAELKTLRAIQPRSGRSRYFDGRFEIPSFEEILALACESKKHDGTRVGVYPETKHPKAFEAMGLSYDDQLLKALNGSCFQSQDDPVFIQSFEVEILKRLRPRTSIRMVYLTEKMPNLTMAQISTFADALGPYKNLLLDDQGRDTGFVQDAHAAGLAVHPWTFRDDDLPAAYSDASAEMTKYLDLGIDGLFTDFADTGKRVRALWQLQHSGKRADITR